LNRGSSGRFLPGVVSSAKTSRQRASRRYPLGACESCGDAASDRHHKDGNPFNNARENVISLCRKCHMEIDGRLDKLRERNRQSGVQAPPKPCAECGTPAKPLRRGMCGRCSKRFYDKRARERVKS
jgi:hypothetical protein